MGRTLAMLAITFLLINLCTGVVMNSTVAKDIGIQSTAAGDDAVKNSTEAADKIKTGTESERTLFGMYNAVTDTVSTILGVVTAGPTMLKQMGIPKPITDMLATVVVVIYGLGAASIIRGFNII